MREEFLQYIWANSLYQSNEFVSCSGKNIRILNTGVQNKDSGADFFNARIEIDDVVLAGNIEIHLCNSDWYRHGHHLDAAYNNVILSVVKDADVRVYNSEEREIETIELNYLDALYDEYLYMKDSIRKPGCARGLENIDDAWFYLTLQSIAIERLERKCNDIRFIWEQTGNDWEECFYRLLCKYWAGNVNSDSLFQLALHVPYKILLKYADKPRCVEALLFGCAGLLQSDCSDAYSVGLREEFLYLKNKYKLSEMRAEEWKFMRIRPDSFPTIRIALLASFLCKFANLTSKLIDAVTIEELMDLLEVSTSVYWHEHYQFGVSSSFRPKSMGDVGKNILLINTVIPFVFVYGKERGEDKFVDKALNWLDELKPESNFIVKEWEECGFVFNSALQTQALIQLRREYCDQHRCLQCRIGREVMRAF